MKIATAIFFAVLIVPAVICLWLISWAAAGAALSISLIVLGVFLVWMAMNSPLQLGLPGLIMAIVGAILLAIIGWVT